MYYMAIVDEADLPRETAKDLMRRARESVGGEGELKVTQAREGKYGVLFGKESHRDAFLVSLRRRRVGYVLKEIDTSKVSEPKAEEPKAKAKPTPNSADNSFAYVLLHAVEVIARELRKK